MRGVPKTDLMSKFQQASLQATRAKWTVRYTTLYAAVCKKLLTRQSADFDAKTCTLHLLDVLHTIFMKLCSCTELLPNKQHAVQKKEFTMDKNQTTVYRNL